MMKARQIPRALSQGETVKESRPNTSRFVGLEMRELNARMRRGGWWAVDPVYGESPYLSCRTIPSTTIKKEKYNERKCEMDGVFCLFMYVV